MLQTMFQGQNLQASNIQFHFIFWIDFCNIFLGPFCLKFFSCLFQIAFSKWYSSKRLTSLSLWSLFWVLHCLLKSHILCHDFLYLLEGSGLSQFLNQCPKRQNLSQLMVLDQILNSSPFARHSGSPLPASSSGPCLHRPRSGVTCHFWTDLLEPSLIPTNKTEMQS